MAEFESHLGNVGSEDREDRSENLELSEPNETRDFFISFTGADRDWAAWIAWTIEEAGYSVWFQDWDFKGNFVLEMDRAHTQSRRTIAVLSPAYFDSRFAAPEWAARFAEDGDSEQDLLVPVRIADFYPEGLLKPIIYVDLVGVDAESAKTRLIQRLSGLRRKPTEPPVFPGQPVHREISEQPIFPGKLATHNLPPRNPDFVGREMALDAIQAALAAPDDQPLVLTQAITGLGGVGKTQTALAFAHAQLANHRLVWWLNAEEPDKLAADYATLARPLGLPEQKDQAKLNTMIRDTLQASDAWLLIFDNAEERAALLPYLPTSGQGRILITSRRTDWQGIARTLPLDVMSELDALRLLSGSDEPRATLPPDDLAEAKALADDLGFLPLALAQARAFMTERGYGFADYRMLFAKRLMDVMGRGADGLDITVDETSDPATRKRQRAVTVTWDISIEAAAAKAPGARELLELLAFFAPDPLPRAVLAAKPRALPESLRDNFARDDALAALVGLSLAKVSPQGITTHRLVQAITRESLKRSDLQMARAYAAGATELLLAALPEHKPHDYRSWDHYYTALAHHIVTTNHAELLNVRSPAISALLNETAVFFWARANYASAEVLYKRAIAIDAVIFGAESHNFAIRLSNLALIYGTTGSFSEAEPLYKRAIAIGEKKLGQRHPELAIWLNNLATLYARTGRYAEAEPLYDRAIDIGENALGADHPELAMWVKNRADLYQEAGRYAEAEADHLRAIRIVEGALGAHHPWFASLSNSLAQCYRKARRYTDAETLYKRAITIGREALGSDHPEVASCLGNLANLYLASRQYSKAEPTFREAIAISEKAFGREHPDLAYMLNGLAQLMYATRRYDEAKTLYQRGIAIIDAKLPADHPQQADFRENYANLLHALDRPEEAADLRARAQAVRDARAATGAEPV